MSKQESIDLLHALSNTGVPPSSKTYYQQYTAGDDFRDLARKFEKEIIDLSIGKNGYSPRIIRGPFGVGKTHFLRYLYLKLGENIPNPENTICAWVDLRELRETQDFQYLLIKGLSTIQDIFPEGYQYQKILQTIYDRLATPSIKNKNVSETQRRVITRQVLNNLWDSAISLSPISIPIKFFAKIVLKKLQQDQEKKHLERLRKRAAKEDIENTSQQSQQDDFIYQFIKLGEGKFPSPEFDSYIQTLAKQSQYNQLIDILLRLLQKAGYKRFVVFVDEMEHISPQESKEIITERAERVADILNLFHRLHTKISDQMGKTANNSYPSVAQIMVMPDYLFEDVIRKVDPALHDKWDIEEVALDVIAQTSSTADELIKKIWELHREAGFIPRPNSVFLLDVIKDSLYKELNKTGEAKPATMRHLIPKLIKIIQTDWVDFT